MGLKNQKNLFYTAENLSIDTIKLISTRHERRFHIDVDINWLIFTIARGLRQNEIVKIVSKFLLFFADAGFVVTPICDGARHHSKRASTKRRAERERLRAECFVARCESIKLRQQIRNSEPGANISNLNSILSDRNKTVKKNENQMWPGVNELFGEELENYLDLLIRDKVKSSEGEIRSVFVAKFQADTFISYRAKRKESSLVISSDADFAVYIGPANFLSITGFNFKKGRGVNANATVGEFSVKASSAMTISKIESILGKKILLLQKNLFWMRKTTKFVR